MNNFILKKINISCFDSNLFIQRDEIDNENKLTSFSLPDMFETKKKYRRENNFNYKFKLNDDNALDGIILDFFFVLFQYLSKNIQF